MRKWIAGLYGSGGANPILAALDDTEAGVAFAGEKGQKNGHDGDGSGGGHHGEGNSGEHRGQVS